MQKLSILIISLLFSAAAFGAESITIRALVGPAFFSKADPVSSGFAWGGDVSLSFTDNFGVTGSFQSASGSGYTSPGSISVQQTQTIFGLIPYYGIKRESISGSVGLFVGGAATSNSSSSSSTYPTTSATNFAAGLNATVDVFLFKNFCLSMVPRYVAIFGTSTAGVASIEFGVGLSL